MPARNKNENTNTLTGITGSIANVQWRAISMEDLRRHPQYEALPLPSEVELQSEQDYALFRQDSVEWDLLHAGRLTTSKAAACMGLYEAHSVKTLGIPKGLESHSRALSAWRQLGSEPMTLADMQAYVVAHIYPAGPDGTAAGRQKKKKKKKKTKTPKTHTDTGSSELEGEGPWRAYTTRDVTDEAETEAEAEAAPMFAKEYAPAPRKRSKAYSNGHSHSSRARLAWGSAQEATAVLAAVNYMHRIETALGTEWCNGGSFAVREVGLLPLEAIDVAATHPEAATWFASGELPLMGASPDGLMLNSTSGEIQVLEVKCSSPFVSDGGSGDGRAAAMRVVDSPGEAGVGVWHVPQLQLEMLCAGPQCRAAALVSLSALQGATLYQVPRDDAYIGLMLSWLRKFHITYNVLHNGPPPANFFKSSPGYDDLLDQTRRIALGAKVIYGMPQAEVQRDTVNNDFFFF